DQPASSATVEDVATPPGEQEQTSRGRQHQPHAGRRCRAHGDLRMGHDQAAVGDCKVTKSGKAPEARVCTAKRAVSLRRTRSSLRVISFGGWLPSPPGNSSLSLRTVTTTCTG